ncbi:MAG: hypothetical protein KDD53_01280 [Bdellovibrionales bacterium]|nr:hypothetical protein [Bdellovibrionales bacterium]
MSAIVRGVRVKFDGRIKDFTKIFLDFNGVLATDGILIDGVAERIQRLRERGVRVTVVTADQGRNVRHQLTGILPMDQIVTVGEDTAKAAKVQDRRLDLGEAIAIGNGFGDSEMLRAAEIGIVVDVGGGINREAMLAARMIFTGGTPQVIVNVLDRLLNGSFTL